MNELTTKVDARAAVLRAQREIRQQILTECGSQDLTRPRTHMIAQLVHYDKAA